MDLAYPPPVRWLALISIIVALGFGAGIAEARSAPAVEHGTMFKCLPRAAGGFDCAPTNSSDLDLKPPVTTIVVPVRVNPAALDRPLMVQIYALASAEVYWNGVLIGRNGRVGVDAAGEVPGRYQSVATVPPALVRPGRNAAVVRMSAHHLWGPVQAPMHLIRVAPYADPLQDSLIAYLPALLTMGALLTAAVYFGGAAVLDPGQRGAGLLAAIAAAGALQLVAETVKAFVVYSYPMHLVRLSAVGAMAVLTVLLVAIYAARRFAPKLMWLALGLVGLGIAAALVFGPGFDGRTYFILGAGAVTLLVFATMGMRSGGPAAPTAAAIAVATLAIMALQVQTFLDFGYFAVLSLVLVGLMGRQVLSLREARVSAAASARLAGDLGGELDRLARDRAMTFVELRDGDRVHRTPAADILYLQAADDYCEAHLADGRTILSTASLAQVQAGLPEAFVRIHKSYVVNTAHVTTLSRRSGGGRAATLTGGAVIPIGRTYSGALA